MTSFRNGPKSGEKTAANGAAPHFRNERNFFSAHSPLYFFVLTRLLRSSGNRPSRHTPRENFEAHSELGRDISSNRTVPGPLCAVSHIEGSSTPKFSRLRRHVPILDRPDALFGKMTRSSHA